MLLVVENGEPLPYFTCELPVALYIQFGAYSLTPQWPSGKKSFLQLQPITSLTLRIASFGRSQVKGVGGSIPAHLNNFGLEAVESKLKVKVRSPKRESRIEVPFLFLHPW